MPLRKNLKIYSAKTQDLKNEFSFTTTKNLLPIHIIFGASDFSKIKMGTCPRVDQNGKPLAEQTKMGWVIMLSGRESDIVTALFTKTSVNDQKLCDTDVLELKGSHYKHDDYVYEKFKKQLKRVKECCYQTGLVWKLGNLPLGNNKNGSLGRHNGISDCKHFYLPYKPVIQKKKLNQQSYELFTTLRRYLRQVSLNGCLEK